MNWIKNEGRKPSDRLVHIRLNTLEDNGIEYDARYFQSPDDWDWGALSGVRVTHYSPAEEGK